MLGMDGVVTLDEIDLVAIFLLAGTSVFAAVHGSVAGYVAALLAMIFALSALVWF